MRVIGLLAGVGSLLREAQDAGFDVVGNFETRGPYHSARDLSWDLNFRGVPLVRKFSDDDDVRAWEDADLALGHPPCGSHSVLGNSSAYSYGRFSSAAEREAWHEARRQNLGLLPLFVERVNAFKPRAFALDNLPKILKTSAPESWWRSILPKYHLTFVTMFNWDYGTPQRRQRLWVIGVRKPAKPFVFKPPTSRRRGYRTALEAFEGMRMGSDPLPWEPWINNRAIGHVHCEPNNRLTGDYRTTVKGLDVTCAAQLGLGFLSIPPERAWPYTARHGHLAVKIGRMRVGVQNKSKVVTGLPSIHHPYTGWPLTPRERARLMDWPDDFQLGNESTSWERRELMRLTLFTGKAVPSAFPRYLIPQLVRHLGR